MKKKLLYLFFLSLIVSCSEGDETIKFDIQDDAFESIVLESDLDKTVIDNIARKYSSKPLTKSGGYMLSSIRDENGDVAMYVINFADDAGFVVVSATKMYEPILAFSEKGNFDVSSPNMPEGLKQWKIDAIEDINKHRNLPADSALRYATFWREFESVKKYNPNRVLTRAYEYPELDRIMMDSVALWQSQGYNVYSLYENPTTGDSELDAQIRACAENSILPIYDWQNYSLLIEKEYSNEYGRNNFLKSCWDQFSGYNMYLPMRPTLPQHAYVGCDILSVSQVMRYFEKPTYSISFPYHLENMPFDYSTQETALFIRDVFDRFTYKIVTDTCTGSTLREEYNVIRSYGYSAKLESYDKQKVLNNIYQMIPVIIRGQSDRMGHSWIISGVKQYVGATEYKLYTFVSENELSNVYSCETNQTTSSHFYYMSWGWGGYYDGFYSSNNIYDPVSQNTWMNKSIIYDINY